MDMILRVEIMLVDFAFAFLISRVLLAMKEKG